MMNGQAASPFPLENGQGNGHLAGETNGGTLDLRMESQWRSGTGVCVERGKGVGRA